jgi:hypothetical protein
MVDVELIKKMHEREHSIRDISRMTGWSRQTVRKTLAAPAEPPVYDMDRPRPCPVMDPYLNTVKQWLAEDESAPRKQRHTAKRVFDRLVDEYGFGGHETTVRQAGPTPFAVPLSELGPPPALRFPSLFLPAVQPLVERCRYIHQGTRARGKVKTLSVTSAMVDSQARALRAGVLSRIGLVTSVELAQCILATDLAAYRDNLDYSARRSSRVHTRRPVRDCPTGSRRRCSLNCSRSWTLP